MNYGEVENKLQELEKVVSTFTEGTRILKIHGRDKEYMNILINKINEYIDDLKSKVEHIKVNGVVSYDGDMSYIDKLLNSKAKNIEDDVWKTDSEIVKKLAEISEENDMLRKENIRLKIFNDELKKELKKHGVEPIFTDADLDDIASALDKMFDNDSQRISTTKTRISASQRLDEALSKYREEPKKESIVKKAMKKNLFRKKK